MDFKINNSNPKGKVIVTEFDEEKSINDNYLLIIGLLGMFILPSLFAILLLKIFPSASLSILNYVAYFLGYGLYLVILCMFLKKDKLKLIFKNFHISSLSNVVLFAFLLYFSQIITTLILTFIFPDIGSNANQEGLNTDFLTIPLIVTIFSVVFAPIVEELVFRYTIFRIIFKRNVILAYVVTILLFAGIHFLASYNELQENLTLVSQNKLTKAEAYSILFDDLKTLPIYMVASFVLCACYHVSKNILVNILVHASYNFVTVLIMFSTLGNEFNTSIVSNFLNIFIS